MNASKHCHNIPVKENQVTMASMTPQISPPRTRPISIINELCQHTKDLVHAGNVPLFFSQETNKPYGASPTYDSVIAKWYAAEDGHEIGQRDDGGTFAPVVNALSRKEDVLCGEHRCKELYCAACVKTSGQYTALYAVKRPFSLPNASKITHSVRFLIS